GFECVQAWVTALDVKEGDASLGFMEGSNKFFSQAAKRFRLNGKPDWHKLTAEQEAWYEEQGCAKKRIQCPKGSMVLWDSRTIHSGVGPQMQRVNNGEAAQDVSDDEDDEPLADTRKIDGPHTTNIRSGYPQLEVYSRTGLDGVGEKPCGLKRGLKLYK
ncbi:hypothetical protein HDU93_004773, partial [Gonapodya sp. JEL0774]